MSYKRWIFIAILLFGIGLVLGLVVTPTSITGFLFEDITALEELSDILVPFQFLTVIIIFFKNVSVLLLSFVLSPILCLAPVLALTVNGWFLALVSAVIVQEESISYLLAGLLPHGIFELPAFILGQAAALSFGAMTMLVLFRKERRNQMPSVFKQNLKYLVIAVALLLPAAIIETFFTPLLLT